VIKHRIVERDSFTVTGKSTVILSAEKYTLLPQFWQTCKEDGTIAQLHKFADSDTIIGVGDNNSVGDSFRYMISVETNRPAGDAYDTMIIPKSKWVVFEPVLSEPKYVGPIWEYIFKEFLPNGKYNLADTPDIEVNHKVSDDQYTCEIWIPVVEKQSDA
jgi:AraC family transcriptional regulator